MKQPWIASGSVRLLFVAIAADIITLKLNG
jgi:hypothetical protein